MAGLTEAEFQEFLNTRFDFDAYYSEEAIEASLPNFDTRTGEKLTEEKREEIRQHKREEKKYYIEMLRVASKTELGKQLFNQLSPDTKVTLFVDAAKKSEAYGYCTINHQIAINDMDRGLEANATTFLHELTHEIQNQQKENSYTLATEQDRFMVNKMMEAEARLNTAKAGVELYYNLPPDKQATFFYGLDIQYQEDMIKCATMKNLGLTEKQINQEMLRGFYNDPNWNSSYNKQALNSSNYKMSANMYYANQTNDTEKVQMSYMTRMGLGKEEAAYFFNPDNIACYPRDQVKAKTETMMPIIGCDKKQKVVMENGEVVQKVLYDKNNNVLAEERVLGSDTVCCKTYDAKGNVDKTITTYSYDNFQQKVVSKEDKVLCRIYMQDNKITNICDADDKIIMSKEDVEKQSKMVKDTFGKIMEGQNVDNKTLLEATSIALKDEYGIYSSSTALKSNIEYAFMRKLANNDTSFENSEQLEEFKKVYSMIIEKYPNDVNVELDKQIKENLSNAQINPIETTTPSSKETEEPTKVETPEVVGKEVEEPAKVETVEPVVKEAEEPAKVETVEPVVKETEEPAKVETVEPVVKETEEPTKSEPQVQKEDTKETIDIPPVPEEKTDKSAPENTPPVVAKEENSEKPVQTPEPTTPKIENPSNDSTAKPSEEMILDSLLKEGKLTREQEDKILEMAVFIENKRLKEKEMGLDVKNNYAEQFIDTLAASKDFSEEQKSVALDAAIEAESVELKIAKLRGIAPSKANKTKGNGPQPIQEDVMSKVVENAKHTR